MSFIMIISFEVQELNLMDPFVLALFAWLVALKISFTSVSCSAWPISLKIAKGFKSNIKFFNPFSPDFYVWC